MRYVLLENPLPESTTSVGHTYKADDDQFRYTFTHGNLLGERQCSRIFLIKQVREDLGEGPRWYLHETIASFKITGQKKWKLVISGYFEIPY